jgi:cellobiose phosphorylase
MAISYLLEISDFTGLPLPCRDKVEEARRKLSSSARECAYNAKGFFNGVFTDNGEWIFSDCDPDGETRPYVCANAWAIISGVADNSQLESIWSALRPLKCDSGYRLYYPGFGAKPIANVGRAGSGDSPLGFFENGAPYNHGSHGFLGRAFAAGGKAPELLDALLYMLPYDQERHPTGETLTPPYAIVNCWQRMPLFNNRGGLLFLTGSVAMALRMAYNWMLGIRPGLGALELSPCAATALGAITAKFTLRGKPVTLALKPGGQKVTLNGAPVTATRRDPLTGREAAIIPYDSLLDAGNTISIE